MDYGGKLVFSAYGNRRIVFDCGLVSGRRFYYRLEYSVQMTLARRGIKSNALKLGMFGVSFVGDIRRASSCL